ncbi:MAG: hypothetical protein HY794_18190 [Desulfarculus sp.]|nr:hypothetical protein [Desulfarculus sp.]
MLEDLFPQIIAPPCGLAISGIEYVVVARGQADSPSFPLSTGTFDLATHYVHMERSNHPYTKELGGYFCWDGSNIQSAAWSGSTSPYAGNIAWEVRKIKNLSAAIQHINGNISPTNSTGLQNVDVAITAVPDYTKAVVEICCGGSTAGGYFLSLAGFLSANDNLRYRINTVTGAAQTVYASAVIIPTK